MGWGTGRCDSSIGFRQKSHRLSEGTFSPRHGRCKTDGQLLKALVYGLFLSGSSHSTMDEADDSPHGSAVRIGKSSLQRDRISSNRSGDKRITSSHHGFHLNTNSLKRWDRGSYRAGLVSFPRSKGAHHQGDDNR